MATSLSATGRITIAYVYSGFTHKCRGFVRGLAPVGGSYNINSRTLDANDIVWTDAASALAGAMSNILTTSHTYAGATLEQWDGTVWVPRAVSSPTPGLSAGTVYPATQVTVVLRDLNLKKVKIVVMETNEISPQHFVAGTAGDTNFDNFLAPFLSSTATAAPFNWLVGRGNQYLNVAPFVGATVTLNRKLRRRRGLA